MKGLSSLFGGELCGDPWCALFILDDSGISSKERVVVVAGVIIDADKQWIAVKNEIRKLIAEYVPPEHQAGFTFHATDLFHGTGRTIFDRRRFPRERSHEALKRLLAVPGQFRLPIIYGYVRKEVLASCFPPDEPPRQRLAITHGLAFSLCAVAAEAFMRERASNEIATLHAENNTDTQKMIRLVRRSLGGKSKYNLAELMSKTAQRYLPIGKIVDEISFHEKDDAFLLQLADACALIIRYALEGRR